MNLFAPLKIGGSSWELMRVKVAPGWPRAGDHRHVNQPLRLGKLGDKGGNREGDNVDVDHERGGPGPRFSGHRPRGQGSPIVAVSDFVDDVNSA
jgi:hypothetical protein